MSDAIEDATCTLPLLFITRSIFLANEIPKPFFGAECQMYGFLTHDEFVDHFAYFKRQVRKEHALALRICAQVDRGVGLWC
jgi:hypothetical protein